MIFFTPGDGKIYAEDNSLGIFPSLFEFVSPRFVEVRRPAVELVESVREHVLRALELTVCHLPANDTLAHDGIADWAHVEEVAGQEGLDLLDKLSGPPCRHAAIGAAAVAAWRTLASRAIAHRDGQLPWHAVTAQAEFAVELARWIYGGGYAHKFGSN